MMFSTDAAGVSANMLPSIMELVPFVRNAVGKVGNIAFANGLDVASFTIGNAAPDSFTVTGRISWSATVVELAMGMLKVFFPQSLLAGAVSMRSSALNCMAVATQQIYGMVAGDVPGKLADILGKCFLSVMIDKFGVYELAKAIGQELKIIPALEDLMKILVSAGWNAEDPSYSSFAVALPAKELAWLQGDWLNDCGGRDNTLHVYSDNNGVWFEKEYNADNSFVTYDTTFHLVVEQGEPIIVIDKTEIPELWPGARLRITTTDKSDSFWIKAPSGYDWLFFRGGTPNHC